MNSEEEQPSSKGGNHTCTQADNIIIEGKDDTTIELQKSDNTIIVRQGCDDWADNPISW